MPAIVLSTRNHQTEVTDRQRGFFRRQVKLSTTKRIPQSPHVSLIKDFSDDEEKDAHLDDSSKIMIAFVDRIFSLHMDDLKCFEDAQSLFNTHGALAVRLRETIPRHKIFFKDDTRYFDFGNSPSKDVVSAMDQWIKTELIRDAEIVKLAELDNTRALTELLTFASLHIMSLLSGIYSKDIEEKDIFEVSIVQYPDHTSAAFRLRRVKLYVWAKRTSIAGGSVKRTESGIRGEFMTYVYEKNPEGLDDLSVEQRAKILIAYHDIASHLPSASTAPITPRSPISEGAGEMSRERRKSQFHVPETPTAHGVH